LEGFKTGSKGGVNFFPEPLAPQSPQERRTSVTQPLAHEKGAVTDASKGRKKATKRGRNISIFPREEKETGNVTRGDV